METRRTTGKADEMTEAVGSTGRRAASQARKAGADIGDAIDRNSASGAAHVRRASRKSSAAYEAATDEFDDRMGSLEAQIRRNPLAAAGAALLVGVVLGRFVL
ncbi:hypothetical protein [Hansschlegelia zhihuaiae]|uniref:DUF883 family protein n=1 Tax=Hansschlegelia zhihuaiae TaxID=405005 RepID=A0A4Q0MKY7_9HYPH|nr:hypothetical protein [Hansschlegelia zhihuaiae]RXF74320.1 hypothetical protein EK403_05710 [Hansschlegelia zhihuaiae]